MVSSTGLPPATFCAVFSTSSFSSMRQHRAFAERPADDEAVAAGLHLQREAALHLGMVEPVVLGEFGRDGWKDSGPHVALHLIYQ